MRIVSAFFIQIQLCDIWRIHMQIPALDFFINDKTFQLAPYYRTFWGEKRQSLADGIRKGEYVQLLAELFMVVTFVRICIHYQRGYHNRNQSGLSSSIASEISPFRSETLPLARKQAPGTRVPACCFNNLGKTTASIESVASSTVMNAIFSPLLVRSVRTMVTSTGRMTSIPCWRSYLIFATESAAFLEIVVCASSGCPET